MGGNALVEALASRAQLEHGALHRLAGLRQMLGPGHEIHHKAAENRYLFSHTQTPFFYDIICAIYYSTKDFERQ